MLTTTLLMGLAYRLRGHDPREWYSANRKSIPTWAKVAKLFCGKPAYFVYCFLILLPIGYIQAAVVSLLLLAGAVWGWTFAGLKGKEFVRLTLRGCHFIPAMLAAYYFNHGLSYHWSLPAILFPASMWLAQAVCGLLPMESSAQNKKNPLLHLFYGQAEIYEIIYGCIIGITLAIVLI